MTAFYPFATALACGCTAPLLLFPAKGLGRKFFILCTLVSLGAYAAAFVARGLEMSALHAAAAAALIAYNVSLPAEGGRVATALLAAAAGLGNAGLVADAARLREALPSLGPAGGAWLGLAAVASAALLGTTVVAMLLGHFYLVARGLPFDHLRRAVLAVGFALGLRLVALGAAALAERERFRELWEGLGPEGFALAHGLFIGARLLFGIAAPAALAWMALACVRERSNQSATGILYVVVAFACIGEIIAQHLLVTARVLL